MLAVQTANAVPASARARMDAESLAGQMHGNVSASFVESHNQKIRQHNRRFTRLSSGHSKKFENHCHHLAIFFLINNFARVHSTLRMSPAMAAGIETQLWDIEGVVRLMERKK